MPSVAAEAMAAVVADLAVRQLAAVVDSAAAAMAAASEAVMAEDSAEDMVGMGTAAVIGAAGALD